MPQTRTLRLSPPHRAFIGSVGRLGLAVFLAFLGMIAPQHAAFALSDANAVLSSKTNVMRTSVADVMAGAGLESAARGPACKGSQRPASTFSTSWLVTVDAHAPAATVSSTPFASQHPGAPSPAEETPDSGTDSSHSSRSIETGDDLNDFDDFAYQLRVVFDASARLNREVERGVSLGGRAQSRLEDNRNDKPPRS
jgi:hypothetical protein